MKVPVYSCPLDETEADVDTVKNIDDPLDLDKDFLAVSFGSPSV